MKEQKNIKLNPGELLKDNPAGLIVNLESYDRMRAHFSPSMYQAIQVTKVASLEDGTDYIAKDYIVDGLTRTKFRADINARIPKNVQRPIEATDITRDLLANPKINENKGRPIEGVLTESEYLRAVLPPTIIHAKIAPERIAGHLIRFWNGIAGKELANRIPALIALTYLNSYDSIKDHLPLMLQERFEQSMAQISQIVRESELNPREIVESGYSLIKNASPAIGGKKERAIQIYTALNNPVIEEKIQAALPNKQEQIKAKLALYRGLMTLSLKENTYFDHSFQAAQFATLNRDLNYDQIMSVVKDPLPESKLRDVMIEAKIKKLEDHYSTLIKRELTKNEEQLVNSIVTKRDNQQDLEINLNFWTDKIYKASQVLENSQLVRVEIEKQVKELEKQGVDLKTIELVKNRLLIREEELLMADSSNLFTKRTNELNMQIQNVIVREINGSIINRQIDEKIKSLKLADPLFSEELKYYLKNSCSLDPKFLQKFSIGWIGDTTHAEAQINQIITDLDKLDRDLRKKVVEENWPLEQAFKAQEQRIKSEETPLSLEEKNQKFEQLMVKAQNDLDQLGLSRGQLSTENETLLLNLIKNFASKLADQSIESLIATKIDK